MEQQQREYFLHQQMKTIQEELGGISYDQEIEEMEARSQQKQWSEKVAEHFQKELAKLDVANIAYRVPTAGATVKDGKLHMNSIFPGLTLQYRLVGEGWKTYAAPVEVSGAVEVRTLAGNGKRPSRSVMVK